MEPWSRTLEPHFSSDAIDLLWSRFSSSRAEERKILIDFMTSVHYKNSIKLISDNKSVLCLRDWICQRVAESKRKKPLSPAEIRFCMEALRAAEPGERVTMAVKYAMTEAGWGPECELRADERLFSRWLSEECGLVHSTKWQKISKRELLQIVDTFTSEKHSLDALKNITQALKVPCILDTARFVIDFATLTSAKWTEKYSVEEPVSYLGALIVSLNSEELPFNGEVLDESLNTNTVPPVSEMGLIMRDGTIVFLGANEEEQILPPPRVVREYSSVVAACSIPMASSIVAILSADRTNRKRALVLWNAKDTESYAILHEYTNDETPMDTVDVQRTDDGDLLVQTCLRGADGTAACEIKSYCVRMVRGDLSTLHHVGYDTVRMGILLANRQVQGKVNHWDHTNLMTVECRPLTTETSRVYYGGSSHPLTIPTLSPIACWGNPYKLFVWDITGDVVEVSRNSEGYWQTNVRHGVQGNKMKAGTSLLLRDNTVAALHLPPHLRILSKEVVVQ